MKKSFVISFSLIIAIIASVFNLSGTGNIVTADKALGSGVTYKQIKADSTYNKLQFDIINTQTPGNTVNDK